MASSDEIVQLPMDKNVWSQRARPVGLQLKILGPESVSAANIDSGLSEMSET